MEEALDMSFDRLRMMMMMIDIYIYIYIYTLLTSKEFTRDIAGFNSTNKSMYFLCYIYGRDQN